VFAIQARSLTKRFRRALAVDGVDLSLRAGEVVALLGPNGAGKTTTLMMLLGVTEPDEGTVSLLGHHLPVGRAEAMRHVSFAATYLSVPSDLRVRQFLDFFSDLYGSPRGAWRDLADRFEIGALAQRMGHQLSSGQRTLVGLVRALASGPRLVVLDEPTASLDPAVAARVRSVLAEEQASRGFAMLITSHNMTEIERLCRRIVFLSHGRVVADGAPDELRDRYGAVDLEDTFLHVAREGRA
jgi:ABC-2 type transport system ATP-binding protein